MYEKIWGRWGLVPSRVEEGLTRENIPVGQTCHHAKFCGSDTTSPIAKSSSKNFAIPKEQGTQYLIMSYWKVSTK